MAVSNNRVPPQRNYRVLCQQWTEYNQGGGMAPAGCTYHVTETDRDAYEERHWNHLRIEHHGELPDPYDGPNGDPYWVDITLPVYDKLLKSPLPGLRLYHKLHAAPEGAVNVWRPSNGKDEFVRGRVAAEMRGSD